MCQNGQGSWWFSIFSLTGLYTYFPRFCGAFLGRDIKCTMDGFLELSQRGLINKIIFACDLQEQSTKHSTPANVILTADLNGPTREHHCSIIGMVHQCARFSIAPRQIHKIAIRLIVRCLKGTCTKGYILKPSLPHLNLDCCVDTDFMGTWSHATSQDPLTVKSCTGFIITFASCPVCWCSKIQSEIALNITEAEYITLSHLLTILFPCMG